MSSSLGTSKGTAASHPYTCNTCQVAYRNIDLQKGHMKSDWHRYNLKRRVASLPPISADTFTEKVLQARAASTAEADKAYFERTCEVCHKSYFSENAYHNHLTSQKHKQNEQLAGSPQDEETRSMISSTFSLGEPTKSSRNSVDSDVEDEFSQVVEGLQKAKLEQQQRPSPVKRPSNPHPVPGMSGKDDKATGESAKRESDSTTPVQSSPDQSDYTLSCIFCNYESPSAPLNAHHMERFHGMFIPEKPYLVDLDGLLKMLQEKVRVANQCLYCPKIKTTIFGVQTHMRDKGHCKIPYTTEEEQLSIGDFYDFRSTYSDEDDDDSSSEVETEQSAGTKLGARRFAKNVGAGAEEDFGADMDGDGWETDSSASSLDSADLTAVPAEGHIHQFERLEKHPHHSHRDPRNRHQVDGWHSRAHKHTHAVFHDEYELHLPSGKSVGHRSLNKYYRQNLTHYPTPEERSERLAIEAEDASDDDATEKEPGSERGRQVARRGSAGLVGVSLQKKQAVRRSEQRGRRVENVHIKKQDLAYGIKQNNQKSYYYRYERGG